MKIVFQIRELSKYEATEFVQRHHYSPVMPTLTKHFLGFYVDQELVGVLTLGWGTQPRQTINKMFPGLTTQDYLEIGKMCMDEKMPRNSESQMIAAVIKWIRQHKPAVKFLYTMADGIMGKCGYVYQAANFYFGEKYWTTVYMMENGEKLHPRSSKSLLKENCQFSNRHKLFWMTTDFMVHRGIKKINGYMFRYIYPLTKDAERIMMTQSTLHWSRQSQDYPKEKDLMWMDVTDAKQKRVIDRPSFTFEHAKYNEKNINRHKSTHTESDGLLQFVKEEAV